MEQEKIFHAERASEQSPALSEWKPAILAFIAGHPSGLGEQLDKNPIITDLQISQDGEGLPVYDFKVNNLRAHVAGKQARNLEAQKPN